MVAHQVDVHLRFLRLQLFLDLYTTLDGKLLHNKILLQLFITTPIYQDIFQTLLRAVNLSFVTHAVLLFVATLKFYSPE